MVVISLVGLPNECDSADLKKQSAPGRSVHIK